MPSVLPRTRLDLSRRDAELRELMDDPGCDLAALERTYARFDLVNLLVAGWSTAYRHRIRPLAEPGRPLTLLDVGSGGGDVARALARWARRDGIDLRITGIDPDTRAHDWASARTARWSARHPRAVPPVFRRVTSRELVAAGETFDVVVSNHLLHHLDPGPVRELVADSERLAGRLVVHNDLVRSPAAYRLYSVGVLPLAPGSFLRTDGLRSLRRAYLPHELRELAGPDWEVGPGSFGHQQLVQERSLPVHTRPPR
ncbi:methyltransferase domain-containing protein [Kocuria rhizosphaericola]|uniref:methyltransferase domain-containing protein n=1 Tax=Kocuria rhizosphaericola TaxID=3376284 RepID=UPI0037A5E641